MITELKRLLDMIQQRVKVPVNSQHQLLGCEGKQFTAQPSVVPVGFITTDNERDTQFGTDEDFGTVFNTWTRISRRNSPSSDKDAPDELDAWIFDPVENVIVCTQNTVSLVGFISPELFEDYVFEVEVSSTDGDDDFIGVVIAHSVDPATGQSHIITAMRGLNGTAPLEIDYNRFNFNSRSRSIARVYNGLHWPTFDEPATGSYNGPSNGGGGWGGQTTPIKLRVTRSGDNITVETSDLGETTYLESAKTTFSLDDHPDLEQFKGPQRIGYCCASQRNSTWKTLVKPSVRVPVVDLRDYTVYTWTSEAWQPQSSSYSQLLNDGILKENYLHFNPTTGRYYYALSDQLITL